MPTYKGEYLDGGLRLSAYVVALTGEQAEVYLDGNRAVERGREMAEADPQHRTARVVGINGMDANARLIAAYQWQEETCTELKKVV